MKYIEELSCGDCFKIDNQLFILTSDFRKNGQKLAYSLLSGNPRWMNSTDITETISIYTLDENNNISPVKITHSQTTV